jgi:GPH family glycoside/pentoside/hexuronide:cation symporter
MTQAISKVKAFFSDERSAGKLSNRARFFLALPTMPISLSNVLIHNAYIKYYSDVIGLDVKFVGVIYLVFGIWNAINDPMLGVVIDRIRYTRRRGKYVYIMRIMTPAVVLSSFAMLFSQPSWGDWVIFAVLLGLLFIFDTAQTAFGIAYASYTLVAAPTKDERVDVSVIRTYIANIGGFLGTIIPTLLLVGNNSPTLTIGLFSGVLLINSLLYWLALRNIHDQEAMYRHDVDTSEGQLASYLKEGVKEAFASRAFVSYVLYQVLGRGPISFYFTPFLYLMDHVFNFSGIQATLADVLPGLVMFVFVPFLGRWVKAQGMKRAAVLSSIPAALGFLSLYFVRNFWQVVVGYCIIIVGSQVGGLIGQPMLGAIIDQDEKKTGVRKAGLFTGLNALITIPISGIQAAVFTSLIGAYGFASGSADQSLRALQGIRIGAGLLPVLFVLLGIIPMLFSPIDLQKERELSDFAEQRHRVVEDSPVAMELVHSQSST